MWHDVMPHLRLLILSSGGEMLRLIWLTRKPPPNTFEFTLEISCSMLFVSSSENIHILEAGGS